MATLQQPLFGQADGRSVADRATIDLVALTRVKGLGDEGIARLLALLRDEGGEPPDLFQSSAARLREHYRLRAEPAKLLHQHAGRFREEAVELFERAGSLGIELLVPGGAGYPSRVGAFYEGAPPLLYVLGNRGLLDAAPIAVVNSAQPTRDALGYTFALASRLAEAGQTLLTSAENSSYNLVGLGAKLAGAQVVVVLHHGLLEALTRHGAREPLPLARQVGQEIDFVRTLLVSPFRLDGRWQKGNGPRRDALLAALAATLVAVEVKGSGTMQSLCEQSQAQARRVFVCQFAAPPAGIVNDALIAAGAAPLVPDSVGSNVDLLLAPPPAPLTSLSAVGDLERRRALGQFFTPPPVAEFMWSMIEALGAGKLKRTARIIDPACGDGVFLRAAVERGGRHPATLFGVDIDETLIDLWRADAALQGAKLFRTNGLVDNPAIGLLEATFDVVIGNPPFAGQGLKPLLQLIEQSIAKPTAAQLDFFGADRPADKRPEEGAALEPHRRAILDDLVRHLSRYACWRLRDAGDDALDPGVEPPDGARGLFADFDLSPERNLRACDYQTMAGLIAQWPSGRPLDVSQPAMRNAVRRMAATAIEVYFVERFVRLARPGGLIAAIVPESILASDQLGPLRLRLMESTQLLGVVALPQKVFTGVGANARTGIIFARRYTDAQQREVETAEPVGQGCRMPNGMNRNKAFMISPHIEGADWTLESYLSNILDVVRQKKSRSPETRESTMSERHRGTTSDLVELGDISDRNRWNPGYFEDHFVEVEGRLAELRAVPLGNYIPDQHPDGSKGITYGQVGARELDPQGEVRYLQVVNIRDTGIDFAIKPDRVAEGSHNDPPRSRVQKGDILFTNTAFRGTETLLGRCVVVPRDYGKVNISQDVDRIRVAGASAYYVAVFLKSKFGQSQIHRVIHGVDSQKINFGRIRAVLIPESPQSIQQSVEHEYLIMSDYHNSAMTIKERLLADAGIDPGRFGGDINALAEETPAYKRALREAKERLDHLVAQLEAVIEGRQETLHPFPE